MALFAVLMSVNFTSCDKGDEGESAAQKTNKKLVQMREYKVDASGENLNRMLDFKYDANGLVIKIQEKWKESSDSDWDVDVMEYVWDSNNSITRYWEDGYECCKYTLADGRISNKYSSEDNAITGTYAYDQEGYIKQVNDGCTYTWSGGQLLLGNHYGSSDTFRYGSQECKGFFPLLSEYICYEGGDYLFLAHPELIGAKCISLPIKKSGKYETVTYEYKLASDGYISTCTETTEEHWGEGFGQRTIVCIYEFVWE